VGWEAAGEPPPLLKKEKTEQTHYNTWLRAENVTIGLPFEDEDIVRMNR
jgi:hypothetical protein